jgi:hypothetical protein
VTELTDSLNLRIFLTLCHLAKCQLVELHLADTERQHKLVELSEPVMLQLIEVIEAKLGEVM